MTSIDDVARATGVSTATVSRALRGLANVSEPTRLRVQAKADELGYVASLTASGLATGRTLTMGVVVPSVSRWFYTTVLEGIDVVLRAANYDLMLYNLASRSGDRERVFHRSILRKRTDALIALCMEFTEPEREQLLSLGHPALVIGGPVKGMRHIGIDERGAGRTATEHLIELGHTAIAHLGGDDDEGMNRRVPLTRRLGYRDAMGSAGLPVRNEWMLSGRFSLAISRAVVTELLRRPGERPTAIVANSDEMAIGAILAAADCGISVPSQLSVVGVDNHDLAVSFGLTTIAQDPYEQGRLAASMLLDELGGAPARKSSVRAPSSLLVRTSTAPPVRR
ncbi:MULTISPECIES: LacI family DNA-binding transcriptional regulator [Subtercola]|uniref:LacI family transcriptional regulator n=1 Tax=Subtercola vilae TaxID=2056433 RepID=A0A4T2BQY8_9MICO|nr:MULTISPECIES: LacI family DNA-binding transcriptional regulator [Subtercola]MEA9984485.1 LacI family DNA-binding transcriptional regulator [Subtercola sp. RTI3]TIH33837.1 LacI family transcriptional regulator [Subtercola vilae]